MPDTRDDLEEIEIDEAEDAEEEEQRQRDYNRCDSCGESPSYCRCNQPIRTCESCGTRFRHAAPRARCFRCAPDARRIAFRRVDQPTFHEAKLGAFRVNPSHRFTANEVEVCGAKGDCTGVNEWVAAQGAGVVSDGSLPMGGFEITTAPANGDLYVQHMTSLAAALKAAGAWVDARAGMHVHVDARDFHYWDLRRLIMLYHRVEPALFAMAPPGRRRSSFCEPCGERYMDAVRTGDEAAKKLVEEEARRAEVLAAYKRRLVGSLYGTGGTRGARGWDRGKTTEHQPHGDKYAGARYRAMNLHSWLYRGTIEFRLPPGTVRAWKMIGWGTLFAAFLDSAMAMPERRAAALNTNPEETLKALVAHVPGAVEFIDRRLEACAVRPKAAVRTQEAF